MHFSLKTFFLTLGLIAIPVFIWFFWVWTSVSPTITTLTDTYRATGTAVKQDLQTLPALPFTEVDANYQITDTKEGIDIQFANAEEQKSSDQSAPEKKPLTLNFPKDYSKPIEVKLDDQRTISIADLSGKKDYVVGTLASEQLTQETFPTGEQPGVWKSLLDRVRPTSEKQEPTYLRYQSQDGRKELLYAFQKDQATGEKQLKHWTLYQRGDGVEQEQYQFANAKVKVNESGIAEVYYFGEQDIKNEQVSAQVDSDLMARAQRTLAKEMGEDILNGGHTPDFTIPKPYFIDNTGNKHDGEWKWNEDSKTLSISLTLSVDQYPIALDPTLSFTAPGQSSTGSAITGEGTNNSFGSSLVSGDFNADGKIDLAVGASDYSSNTGRAYIFYNDGSIPTTAATADVTITGETTSNYFGIALTAGDFNADGRTDLAVGAYGYSSFTGRAYIFYNDGSIPTTTATADVTITGETTSNYFGYALTAGDFNADGRTDLAVGAFVYSPSFVGRVYIFLSDSSIPTTAATADVTITGETTNNFFGNALTAGDFNADGRTDLAVGAKGYSTNTGRAYIFYNDGSIPTAASSADVTITGETTSNFFGYALTAGDFNADGKTDLAVGASGYSSSTGRAYIFYGDGSIPTTAGTADVTITGEVSSYFGVALTAGDFNADGRTDLAVGAYGYSSFTGRAYIFYNDGSIPTTTATADVTITGEAINNNFGYTLTAGDFNNDGKTDLAVGASGYSSSTGRAYIFYSQNGQVNTNQNIGGAATSDYFGWSMTAGDLNADGRTDLVVGAWRFSSGTGAGRAYIFYNDGSIVTSSSAADAVITGEAGDDKFSFSLATGDMNADGKVDLIAGAVTYPASNSTGRIYIFYNGSITTENASGADVIISGASGTSSGTALITGDFNADGRTDLAVGGNFSAGVVYIFYNDGSIPTTVETADVTITGEASSSFGTSLTAGDFDADGRTDLAVGASGYSTNTGRAYLFYNDGSIPTAASSADVTITGETTSNSFGTALTAGDFNADGRTDLAVSASGYSSSTGRAYIFYNDGSIPTAASSADVTITGETTSNNFGVSLTVGDFNADGTTDLVVGASGYSSSTGRAYIFLSDGSIPTAASSADVTITGETTSNSFGISLTAGDWNADGRTDLAVGAKGYSSNTGKVYLYETRENFAWEIQQQSGSSLRTGVNTSGQELRITGEVGSSFGYALTAGDFNADGRIDLAVGANGYSTNTGRVYIFYNDGSLSTGASSADVVITGSANSAFGGTLVSGDFNADGRSDLAVGSYNLSSNSGHVYIFYNDGSYPVTSATADIIISDEDAYTYFSSALTAGDFNADGKTDLAVGSWQYGGTNTGRIYIFYNGSIITENASGADVTITGEAGSYFGIALTAGDFNADGKIDLAVGARGYANDAGRVYLFYNDGSYPALASGADVIIDKGTGCSYYFGMRLIAGDMNADGKTDLIVSTPEYGVTGKVFIFYNDGAYPATSNLADVKITGSGSNDDFGNSLATGDFNADGRTDLAVGDTAISTSTGRVYIFYSDGSIPTTAATADVTLTGETTSNSFGTALTAGDFNADGRTDLAVGARGYSTNTGRVYMYTWNDPVITGETTNNYFGYALSAGDFNADGRTDLAVGAYGYSTNTGRVYIFYNDGSIPTTAAAADVTITGEASSRFGQALASGDFNADGKIDLAVGAVVYSSNTGRAYIFYNDGTIPTTAATADVTITGETVFTNFGITLAAGDLNADGKTDLIAAAPGYSNGRVSVFYADGTNNFGTAACTGSSPTVCLAANADVKIDGDSSDTGGAFGSRMILGDFNADGRIDLALGSIYYNTDFTGRVYIFYNDGSLPTTAATADVIITGETTSNWFGSSLAASDFNSDGRTDLAVGASAYSSNTGRAYIFYNDGSIPTTAATADVTITGETTNNYFGAALTAGDFNADGRTDLAVGAYGYSTNTGRVYIFYNDGTLSTTATTADVTITGGTTNNYFGYALSAGDFNADGRTDLAVGAYGYSTNTGRAYIFITEASVETTPNVTTTRGGVKFRGTVKLR